MSLDRAIKRFVEKNVDTYGNSTIPNVTNMPDHLLLGYKGEELAIKYLIKKQYKIIDRNVRYSWGEIDIIAEDDEELVFVEVRTRKMGIILPPEKTVGPSKLKKLIRSCRTWTESKDYAGFWRIDLVAITVKEKQDFSIKHIKNITEAIL